MNRLMIVHLEGKLFLRIVTKRLFNELQLFREEASEFWKYIFSTERRDPKTMQSSFKR